MRTVPWLLAWARLRKYPLRNLSLVVLVAFGLSVMLGLSGIAKSTRNSITNYSLAQLSAGDRNFTVNSSQILSSTSEYLVADKYLEKHLSGFSNGAITHEAIYSQLSDLHGVRFNLGAVNDVKSSVKLVSGRWPLPCTAGRCEVIEVGESNQHRIRPQSFGLIIVGVGAIVNSDVFAGTMSPASGTVLLLTSDIHGIATLPRFVNIHGANAWVTMINIAEVNKEGISNYISQVVAFEDQMSIDLPNLILTWPQDALSVAGEQSDQFLKKSNLIGFAVISLLLAFLTIGAIRQRRSQQKFRASLGRIGTSKQALLWETLLESALPIKAGILMALVISPVVIWVLGQFGYHGSLVQIYTNWSRSLLAMGAAIFLTAGISIFKDHFTRLLQGASFVVAMGFFGGFLSVSGVGDSKFLLMPFIYAAFPSVLSYLCMHYIVKLFRRTGSGIFLIFREFIAIWRGIAVIVSLASILAIIALAFDSGISQSVTQRSRDLVPLDVSITTSQLLVKPLDLASAREYSTMVPGSVAYPILRTGSAIRNQEVVSDSLALIGAPPAAIASASSALKNFANSLKPIAYSAQNLIPIQSSRSMSVVLTGIPPQIDLTAWFLTPRGLRVSAPFQSGTENRKLVLAGQIPYGSSLIALEFQESSNYLSRRLHAIGEGNYSVPTIKGIGSILKISLDGHDVTPPSSVWGTSNFPYSFDGASLYVRPQSDQALSVVATDPVTARLAERGILTLSGGGNSYFRVRVGAVVNYFPSAGDRFVLMDLSQMQNEIGMTNLGATDPIELWVSTPDPIKYLAQIKIAPFASLGAQSRQALEKEFSADPNSSGLTAAYRLSLLFALILALFVTWTALAMLRRDGAQVLYYLESMGSNPKYIRKSLQIVVGISIAIGLAIGSLLGTLVSRLYISHSIPYVNFTTFIALTAALGFIGVIALSSKFFTEKSMVSQ